MNDISICFGDLKFRINIPLERKNVFDSSVTTGTGVFHEKHGEVIRELIKIEDRWKKLDVIELSIIDSNFQMKEIKVVSLNNTRVVTREISIFDYYLPKLSSMITKHFDLAETTCDMSNNNDVISDSLILIKYIIELMKKT